MSDKLNVLERLASASNPSRKLAVACALDLIKQDLTTSSNTTRLETHMKNLSGYADTIEAALNKE